MSVRSRIAQFESLTREGDSNKNKTNEASTEKRKRFHHPGSIKKTQEPEQPVTGMGPPRVKPSGVPDIEADLQEVWSVRRNIHHTGKSKSTTSVTLPSLTTTAGKYSRHGAIPAHQSQGPVPQTVPGGHLLHIVTNKESFMNKGLTTRRDDYPLDTRQKPLQEYNFQSSPWNVRTGHYTYSEVIKESPSKERDRLSPGVSPTAKRKPNLNVGSVRATYDVGSVRPTYDVGGVRPTYDVGGVRPTYDVGGVRPTYDVGSVRPTYDVGSVRATYDVGSVRATYDEKIHSFPPKRSNKDENERVSYAKRMARGYLRSVGVGEYTPRRSGYSKESENEEGKPTKWKKLDYHDEFDF